MTLDAGELDLLVRIANLREFIRALPHGPQRLNSMTELVSLEIDWLNRGLRAAGLPEYLPPSERYQAPGLFDAAPKQFAAGGEVRP